MKNEWDDYAEGWDIDPTVEMYAKNAFSELTANIDINGLAVLDFGCGTGSLTKLMSPYAKSVLAIDPSSEMIKHLNSKRLNNVCSIADYLTQDLIESTPELNHQFDLIVASSVCSFLDDYDETLKLLRSLLKGGGRFVQWDWYAEGESSEMGLTEQRVANALLGTGFDVIKVNKPFVMTSSKGNMPVLMAIAKKA
ncbi:methyltransferase domain-containing protein [Psychrosphaera haliotis]|uniref:class I SAM-dependent DNA methyltransferase n=1 Tax=Psychrosphaera haliotis TaxID=555083 RepID=UPI0031DD68EA